MTVDRHCDEMPPFPATHLSPVDRLIGPAMRWRFLAKPHPRWGEVEPGFFRSGQLHPTLLIAALRHHKIDLVVDLHADRHRRAWRYEATALAEIADFEHRIIRSLNGHGIGAIRRYADALTAVLQARGAGRRVLVHCHAGAQRTGATVAFFRLLVQGRSPTDVLAELRQYGWHPRRNAELIPYMNDRMGRLVDLLVERRVLPDGPPDALPQLGGPS